MWARIEGNRVAEITDVDPEGRFHPSLLWVECDEDVKEGHLYDGENFHESIPQETPVDEIKEQKIALIQYHMDSEARKLNYDSIANAITYAEEPIVPKFQNEGRAFREWRSLVWEKCYQIFEEVQAGERDIPTDDELILELPALELPENE